MTRRLPDPGQRAVSGAASVHFVHDGLNLHALDFPGDAPAVVFVPGITSPAATWAFFVRALGLPNRVLILDCRGRGLSDSRDGDHSLDAYAGDLKALIDQQGLEKPVLIGHSMGARVVSRFDRLWPNVASRLCAIDPPLSGPGRRYPIGLQFYFDAMDALDAGQSLAEMRAKTPGWSDERLLDRATWLPSCDRAAIAGSYASFHEEEFHADWRAGDTAATLVYGAISPVVQETDLADLREARPAARFISVPDAGHMIPWDNLAGAVSAVRASIDWKATP